jgi:hypothetical protein
MKKVLNTSLNIFGYIISILGDGMLSLIDSFTKNKGFESELVASHPLPLDLIRVL